MPKDKEVQKKAKPVVEESSSDSSSESSSAPPAKPAAKAAPAKKEDKKPVAPPKKEEKKKKAESSDESSSSSESAAKKAPKKDVKKVEKKEEKPAAKKKDASSSSDSGSDDESSEEKPTPKNDKKRKAEAEPEESASTPKKAKTEASGAAAANPENTRLFIGNLSFKIDDDAIKAFFADVGELVDIHWVTDRETGKFYGTGFIAFNTVDEAKAAVAKSGQEVLGRPIRIDFAQQRGDRAATPRAGGQGQGRQGDNKAPRTPRETTPKPDGCTTVFLGNLAFAIDEKAVRSHFGDCGDITSIRWVERDGQFKGCGFVEFGDTGATDKAVALNGSDLLGRSVRVDYSAPKAPRQ